MSMTLLVVVGASCVLTTANLADYSNDSDLPIVFTHEADLKIRSGFLPVLLSGVESGVETYFDQGAEFIQDLPPNDAIGANKSLVTFRWGSSFKEGAVAFYIAYILGKKCDGVIFETEDGEYIAADMMKSYATQMMSTD